MVGAVLSNHEVSAFATQTQRNISFSLLFAVALHIAIAAAIVGFGSKSETSMLIPPVQQVIQVSLMTLPPKPEEQPVVRPVPVTESQPKSKPAFVKKAEHKPALNPVPKPTLNPVPAPVPNPVAIAAPETPPVIQKESGGQTFVAEEIEPKSEPLPNVKDIDAREATIAKETYEPPSSTVAYYQNPKPRYPSAAKRRGMQGVVKLRVLVDAQGNPVEVELQNSSGHNVLDREAMRAVWKWRFTPARRAGVAVSGDVIVPVRFELSNA